MGTKCRAAIRGFSVRLVARPKVPAIRPEVIAKSWIFVVYQKPFKDILLAERNSSFLLFSKYIDIQIKKQTTAA